MIITTTTTTDTMESPHEITKKNRKKSLPSRLVGAFRKNDDGDQEEEPISSTEESSGVKTVSFSDYDQMRTTLPLSEYKEDERKACWFDGEEMKASIQDALQVLDASQKSAQSKNPKKKAETREDNNITVQNVMTNNQ